MSPTARIAIVGAGPAGLCLGALLRRQGIPFTVYELRGKPADDLIHVPSGMLDLHPDGGQAALRECGLWEQFQKSKSDCSEADIIMDEQARVHHKNQGQGGNKPEIARNSLTHMLLRACDPANVRWEHKLVAADRGSDGNMNLDFGSHGKAVCDFVVGADGAWSKIRPLLTSARPEHGGIHYTTLYIPNASEKHPQLAKLVGDGQSFILGGRNGLITHRGVGGSIIIYVSVSTQHSDSFSALKDNADPSVLERKLLDDPSLFQKWHPSLQDLIRVGLRNELAPVDPKLLNLRSLSMMPVGHRWQGIQGATLIGDAAHLMMPWAGEGVNLAMRDALNLSKGIGQAWKALPSSAADFQALVQPRVAEYEAEMFKRSKEAGAETKRNSGLLFGHDNSAPIFAGLMAHYTLPEE